LTRDKEVTSISKNELKLLKLLWTGGTLRHMVIYGIRTFSSLWCFPALPKQSFSSRDYNEEFHSSISSPGRAENRSRVM
jgi:hypothetical protein